MSQASHRAGKAGSISATTHATPSGAESIRTINSQELLGSQGVLYIRHLSEVYRLQTTRFGKLILTK